MSEQSQEEHNAEPPSKTLDLTDAASAPDDDGAKEPLMFEEEGEDADPAGRLNGNNGCVKQLDAVAIELSRIDKSKNASVDKLQDSEEGSGDGEEVVRAAWGGKLEFLFTCIGYAVGLGNIWRFPYLCYKNGGGAFLIPYILMLGFVGLPLFFMELGFGQFASLGPITIWKMNPLLKGLGYAMVSVSWLIAVYYNVIISHVMLYLFASFAAIPSGLPWVSCGNWWNTEFCLEHEYSSDAKNQSLHSNVTANPSVTTDPSLTDFTTAALTTASHVINKTLAKTPAEEYYNHFVLEISDGIEHANGVNWKLALCLLLSWIIVLICLIRGITSLGKVVYFTAIFPYIMLTILLIRGVTLPGAGQGIIYYLKPDFSRLSDPRVWSDAATQIFYSLSACSGGLIAMASYNKFDNNCYKDSLIVALINCGTSIYGGFVIFSILGFMALEKGVSVGEVAQGGPGLAFVVYPEALSRMPAPQLWAIFFFFMMATLGFGSQFSIVECVLSAFTDEFVGKLKSKKASIIFRISVILFTFLMGLPMVTRGGIYLLDLVDYSVSGFPLLFVGLIECGSVVWVYGYRRFAADIELMLGHKPNFYWKACWLVLTPVVIIVTIIFNCIFYKPPKYGEDYFYPDWAQALGWLIGLFPISLIVIFFLWRYCRDGGFTLMKELAKPKIEWGPLLSQDRKGTIYEDQQGILDGVESPPWRYDPVTQRFIFPPTINLAQTPSGSMYNIAQVTNYTGPIPVILSMPESTPGRLGVTKRQISVSMSELGPQGHGGGRHNRNNAGSVPHLPHVGLSRDRASQRSSRMAGLAHMADRTASSMANLAQSLTHAMHPSMRKAPSATTPIGSEPNSGINTPVFRGSRANSRASAQIHLRPDMRYDDGDSSKPETSV